MSDQITKKDVEEIVGKVVDKAVGELSEVIASFATQVDKRFNKVDKRFDQVDMHFIRIEDRLDRVEKRLDEHDVKFDKLLNTMDRFLGRLDQNEIEQAARDSQFEKLLDWARKVSVKTGIPLENL